MMYEGQVIMDQTQNSQIPVITKYSVYWREIETRLQARVIRGWKKNK